MTFKMLAVYFYERLKQFDYMTLFKKMEEYNQGSKHALQYLLQEEETEVTAGMVANELSISTARVAKLINNLSKNGYIDKWNSKKDARVTIVKITEKGKKYIIKEKEDFLKTLELVIDKIGVEDLMEFIRISKKIKKAFIGVKND